MFHRFGLYRAKSLHSFISQTEIHTGPSLGVFETWVRLSYFGAFVNTQVNVRQSHRENDTFRLFSKVLSAAPLHNFCGLVHISEIFFPRHNVRYIAVTDGVDSLNRQEMDITPFKNILKINFGNYSTEGVLNSLIGSPLGYIGSEEGGELINKIDTSKSKVILIDEFEKATPSVYNFFYELLEDGVFTDRHGIAHNLDGYLIIFTSNMTEVMYHEKIPDSLKSRFDMVYHFVGLPAEEKQRYIQNTAIDLIENLEKHFGTKVEIHKIQNELNELCEYDNLRDIKRNVEDIVFNSFLGQFTRNYMQTVKRAADNKRRYAPGKGHSACLLWGYPKGATPHLAHDFAKQSVVCYTLCRRCRENAVAAGEGKGI